MKQLRGRPRRWPSWLTAPCGKITVPLACHYARGAGALTVTCGALHLHVTVHDRASDGSLQARGHWFEPA
jgi:hypothetical protein